jgi:hypothetical protein
MLAMVKGTIVSALAVFLTAMIGDAVALPSGAMVAQRGGGRGTSGQSSAGIRTLVKGRVTAVDPATNRVTLALGSASVEAKFPAAVVADVTPGDNVFVTVELIDTRVGVVTGAVTAVDPASGAVTITTPGGPWTPTFSANAVGEIKPGDQAVLKLELVDLGPPPPGPPPLLPGPSAPEEGRTR